MDGPALTDFRLGRNWSAADFGKVLSADLGKKIDAAKIGRWEAGLEKIPADVEGFLSLSSLAFTKPAPTKGISVAVVNRKGGIGKTSITVNLGYVLARAGARVLIVDADAQGNSTLHVGIEEIEAERLDRQRKTLYDILKNQTPVEQCIKETTTKNLHIIPSYSRLAIADEEFSGELELIKANLSVVHEQFDFVLYDCAPSMSTVTKNCLMASKYALIPVQTEPHSIVGLARMLTTLTEMRRSTNRDLEILGIVPTMHQARIGQNKDSLLELYSSLSKKYCIYSAIPRSSIYPTSASVNVITIDYDKGVPGLKTFVEIAASLFERASGDSK